MTKCSFPQRLLMHFPVHLFFHLHFHSRVFYPCFYGAPIYNAVEVCGFILGARVVYKGACVHERMQYACCLSIAARLQYAESVYRGTNCTACLHGEAVVDQSYLDSRLCVCLYTK